MLQMVGPGRVERPTSRLSGVRSNHLSYEPQEVFDETSQGQRYRWNALTRRHPHNGCAGIRRKRKGNEGGVKAAIV